MFYLGSDSKFVGFPKVWCIFNDWQKIFRIVLCKLKSSLRAYNCSQKAEKLIRWFQKQPPRGVLKKRCPGNMQQIYRRTPMPKCDFNKVASNFIEITLWHGCSAVNLLHIFRRSLPRNTPAWLLLKFVTTMQQVKCSPFQQKIANLTLKSWILSRKFKEYITCLDFIYGKGV